MELSYRDEIEKLKEESDFETLGDKLYLNHKDEEARLQWAFYRPSGSHPKQVSDKSPIVSIMAFNHSRLTPYKRFTKLNQEVIKNPNLRVKIKNRSRMLFRAMIDDDLTELIKVLEFAPIFLDLASHQMINGRVWSDKYANLKAVSNFLKLVENNLNEELEKGIIRRLQPIKNLTYEEAKEYLTKLILNLEDLHPFIKKHYFNSYNKWLENTQLHPLQKIALKKEIIKLKEEKNG